MGKDYKLGGIIKTWAVQNDIIRYAPYDPYRQESCVKCDRSNCDITGIPIILNGSARLVGETLNVSHALHEDVNFNKIAHYIALCYTDWDDPQNSNTPVDNEFVWFAKGEQLSVPLSHYRQLTERRLFYHPQDVSIQSYSSDLFRRYKINYEKPRFLETFRQNYIDGLARDVIFNNTDNEKLLVMEKQVCKDCIVKEMESLRFSMNRKSGLIAVWRLTCDMMDDLDGPIKDIYSHTSQAPLGVNRSDVILI